MTRLLSIHAAAARLGITTGRLRRLVDAGELPHIDLPDVGPRFLEEDLVAWLRTRRSSSNVEM